MTYIDHGPSGSNAYFGGAVDTCHWNHKHDDECWRLAINRVKPNGLNEKQTQLRYKNNDHEDEESYAMIDHMQNYNDGSNFWMFGTTSNETK